jgi:hypothetical protein
MLVGSWELGARSLEHEVEATRFPERLLAPDSQLPARKKNADPEIGEGWKWNGSAKGY